MKRRNIIKRLDVILEGEVGDPGTAGVRHRAAEFFGGDVLVGHGLHHLRAGDEHVRAVLDHEDEVGSSTGYRRRRRHTAHDQRDLRMTPEAITLRWKTSA